MCYCKPRVGTGKPRQHAVGMRKLSSAVKWNLPACSPKFPVLGGHQDKNTTYGPKLDWTNWEVHEIHAHPSISLPPSPLSFTAAAFSSSSSATDARTHRPQQTNRPAASVPDKWELALQNSHTHTSRFRIRTNLFCLICFISTLII